MGGDMLSVTTYGFNKTGGENIIGENYFVVVNRS
jgi:hypothetical protein